MKTTTVILLTILILISGSYAITEDNFDRIDSTILGTATNGNAWSELSNWEIKDNSLYNDGLSASTNTAKLQLANSNPLEISYDIEN